MARSAPPPAKDDTQEQMQALRFQIESALRTVPKRINEWSHQEALKYKVVAKSALQMLGHKRQAVEKLKQALESLKQYVY